MPFTVAEFETAANAAIEFRFKRGQVLSQSVQDKPLLKMFRNKTKTFAGGNDNITVAVKGTYTTSIQGFSHDDSVGYSNPANIKKASYPWKLIHAGIQFTTHELIKDGISLVDTTTGKNESQISGRDETALANMFEDKLDDFAEGWDRSFNTMLWRDGTQDANLVPGVRSFILDNPASATVVAGLDQNTNAWWRNRATLNISTANAANQTLVQLLQNEVRQLRKFGGRPTMALCGSAFLDWFEQELRAKGNYTLEGWAKSNSIDASVADVSFKGISFEYDPTLDDLGLSKYAYVLDPKTIYPMVVTGEDMKKHAPARPENKYVFYRAMTWIGGLVCVQRNANGVYSIA
jgi:hypothetical protein